MRDEGEVGTARKNDEAPKRYLVVAKELENCLEFTKMKVLAENAEMSQHKFRHSVTFARRHLAMSGIIIVNRVGEGYKIGSIKEFEIEVDKACKRALAQMSSMAKLIGLLKESEKVDGDLDSLMDIVKKNLRRIDVIFGFPEFDDFDSYDDFKDAVDGHIDMTRTAPDFIKDIPLEPHRK